MFRSVKLSAIVVSIVVAKIPARPSSKEALQFENVNVVFVFLTAYVVELIRTSFRSKAAQVATRRLPS